MSELFRSQKYPGLVMNRFGIVLHGAEVQRSALAAELKAEARAAGWVQVRGSDYDDVGLTWVGPNRSSESEEQKAKARFVAAGDGRVMNYPEGSVAVWRGATTDGVPCVAVQLKHVSGADQKFLLTINGAVAAVALLTEALNVQKT